MLDENLLESIPITWLLLSAKRRLSYAEFNSRVNRLANALYKHGIRPGDNVAVLMYNCPEMLESMFAGFKAGCGVVPINFRLHPKEYASIIKHSEAKAVILSPEFNEEIIKHLQPFPPCHVHNHPVRSA